VLSIARQIARGKRAATADTRVLAPAHPSQVHTRDHLQMEPVQMGTVGSPGTNGAHQCGTVVHMVDSMIL